MNIFNKEQQAASENTGGEKSLLGSRQRRLLADSLHVEEELVPSFVRSAMLVLAGVIIAFVVWAALTELPEIAKAPGEVQPNGEVKVVQHLDGGVVSEILIEERRLVKAGQVLFKLDGVQANAELNQLKVRLANLRARSERLQAQTEQRRPDFSRLSQTDLALLKDQTAVFNSQQNVRSSSLSILDHQINQRSSRVQQLKNALASAQEQAKVSGEILALREELAEKRLINRSTLLDTQRANLTVKGEVERITQEIAVISQELAEVMQRRADFIHQGQRDNLAELAQVHSESNEIEQAIKRIQSKVSRLDILAPASGYVHDLRVQTVGQVILPGALLMQVVPDKVALEAVIRISTQDIGYVKVGQAVNLRAVTYDYARHGFAKGILKRVSASHIVGDDGKPYFRGWVSLTQAYVGNDPTKYPLQTGMGVVGEIRTGEKTLLAYLAKPLVNAVSGAFQER